MPCPKCGSATWEDNFWSGCTKCSWAASCEHNIKVVPDRRQETSRDEEYVPYDYRCED